MAKVTSNTTTPSLPNGVPGSPGIDQYGTGTGAGNRHSAHVVYILLLSIAAFFALLGKKQQWFNPSSEIINVALLERL